MASLSTNVELSVVIPAYNEQGKIIESIKKVAAYLTLTQKSWQLIVSSDGSTDKTVALVKEYIMANPLQNVSVLDLQPNHGKGYAVRKGVEAATGEYILLTDADLSSPIKEVNRLILALQKGADVAIGSRAIREKDTDVQQSFKRYVSGRIFNRMVRLLVLPGIYDSQCGFKCFTKDAAKKLFAAQKLDGFSFDVEVLYLARKFGLKIAEVPVMWRQGPDSRVSLLNDSIRMFGDLFKIVKLHDQKLGDG